MRGSGVSIDRCTVRVLSRITGVYGMSARYARVPSAGRLVRWVLVPLAVVALGTLAISVLRPAGAATGCPTSVPDTGSARSAAQACGGRVEDLSRRSETTQVFLNPDGTATSVQSARPRFVRAGDGSWAAADATLVRNPDGTVSPRAATFAMRFS